MPVHGTICSKAYEVIMVSSHFYVQPGGTIEGVCHVPGDKSISHRAIILSAISSGVSQIDGFLEGMDCMATIDAFRQMGVVFDGPFEQRVIVHGVGKNGLQAPDAPIDLGNSGTSMRLLAGLLAGQKFSSELVGDASLMRRPMARVIQPLTQMGAKIEGSDEGTAPLKIKGGQSLRGMDYICPVASAQVKSSILLAGLYAEGETAVSETSVTRDHTERMLTAYGYPIKKADRRVSVHGDGELTAMNVVVPGDISSAAFLIVAACIVPDSNLLIKNVGINPTRIGIIPILKLMGANIKLLNKRICGDEPVADIAVSYGALDGIEIPLEYVSLAIDEFPAIFIAAACAHGRTVLRGAKELRVKESDRIQSMVDGLIAVGIEAEALEDGAIIDGGVIRGGVVDSFGDHRVAMAFAIAGMMAKKPVTVTGSDNVLTSFPGFADLMSDLGMTIEEK